MSTLETVIGTLGPGGPALARRPRARRLVLAALPAVLGRMFDPSRAADLVATFELTVTAGDRPADVFALRIEDGRLTVTPGPVAGAGARVRVAADDLVALAAGSAHWPELMAGNRLALSGDPFLALRFPAVLGLPAG